MLVWLLAAAVAAAQGQGRPPKVGVLWMGNSTEAAPYLNQFKEGLRERGWVEGRTVQIIERYDQFDASRRPKLAAELVALGVELIYVTDPLLPAAKNAAPNIPIVCADFYDPVAEGYAESLAKPVGNVTGISWQSVDSGVKRLQLARELVPRARQVGMLIDANDPGARIELQAVMAAARKAGISLGALELRTPQDVEAVLANLKGSKLDALILPANSLTWGALDRIIEVATANRIPTISEPPAFAELGSVISYGVDMFVLYRRSAHFVDRILKGAKPSELPFEQPTKFDFVVNLKAARAIGVEIPKSFFEHATRVLR
jgi:putative ABC transport system substrate-binding protein